MRVLSFDQATNICGWSLFEGDTKELINHGIKDFSKTTNLEERIHIIKQWINEMIILHNAEILAIEDIQYQQYAGVKAYKPLAMLLGVCQNTLFEKELLYFVIKSSEWKSSCKVKGRARKEQKLNAQKFIKDTYNIEASEDECDAICIGYHMVKKIVSKIKVKK